MAGAFEENVAGRTESEEYGRRRKNSYADDLEEDTGGGTDIFRPPVLMHLQIAADILIQFGGSNPTFLLLSLSAVEEFLAVNDANHGQGLGQQLRPGGSLHGFQIADHGMFDDICQGQADQPVAGVSA